MQRGLDSSNPAASCAEIAEAVPTSPSGYYWLQSANGSAVNAYCDMSITCQGVRGWMRVVNLNVSDTSQECPPNTRLSTVGSIRICGINDFGAGCSSAMFNVQGVTYGQVCGRIIGYQQGFTDAFATNSDILNGEKPIDAIYVDGVSLTHGSSPRKHIWTFASARDEVGMLPHTICPCTNTNETASATPPPSFVGNDYFCDTGSTDSAHLNSSSTFYADDPLWDGAGCGPANTCCSFNNPPWFLKQLPSTTADDIEMRICRDEHQTDERPFVEIIDLYIR